MAAAGQFQRHLPESPKAIVEEIFAHVLAFGEDENAHPAAEKNFDLSARVILWSQARARKITCLSRSRNATSSKLLKMACLPAS